MSNYIFQNVLIDVLSKTNSEKFLLLYSTDIYLDEEYIKEEDAQDYRDGHQQLVLVFDKFIRFHGRLV